MGPPNCPGHIPGRAPLRESQFGFRLNSRGSNISNSAVLPLLSYPGPALVVARCSIPWSCLHQHKLAPTLSPQILPPISRPTNGCDETGHSGKLACRLHHCSHCWAAAEGISTNRKMQHRTATHNTLRRNVQSASTGPGT